VSVSVCGPARRHEGPPVIIETICERQATERESPCDSGRAGRRRRAGELQSGWGAGREWDEELELKIEESQTEGGETGRERERERQEERKKEEARKSPPKGTRHRRAKWPGGSLAAVRRTERRRERQVCVVSCLLAPCGRLAAAASPPVVSRARAQQHTRSATLGWEQ